jgi:hypothetical protein
LRQRRVAAGCGLGTGLGTTIKYVRSTASGAAGNGLGTTIKYLRRIRYGFSGSGLVTTVKYLQQTTAAGNRLASTIKYLRGASGIGLGTTIKVPQCATRQRQKRSNRHRRQSPGNLDHVPAMHNERRCGKRPKPTPGVAHVPLYHKLPG